MLMLHSSAALYVAGLEAQMAERGALAPAISDPSVGVTRRWTHKQLQSPSLQRIFVKMSKEEKRLIFFPICFFHLGTLVPRASSLSLRACYLPL